MVFKKIVDKIKRERNKERVSKRVKGGKREREGEIFIEFEFLAIYFYLIDQISNL